MIAKIAGAWAMISTAPWRIPGDAGRKDGFPVGAGERCKYWYGTVQEVDVNLDCASAKALAHVSQAFSVPCNITSHASAVVFCISLNFV